jgi:lysozyme
MIASKQCIDFIKKFEGFFAKSYVCPAGKNTIGFGSTMWKDGKPIKMGEVITMDGAIELMEWELKNKSIALQGLNINQNQFDSLLSFIYNCGIGAFNRSTLKKKIRINPNDPTIRDEFMRWINKGSSFEKGLRNRRKAEADMYFKPQ